MKRPSRVCGSCSACCRAMAVHELEKDAWQACKHLHSSGCGIYARRPASCRNFACQWLRGVLEVDGTVDSDLRPDACGVIFDYQPGTAFGDVYTAWEVEPGASARGHARDIIEGLAERFRVMIVSPDRGGEDGTFRRRFVGPGDGTRGSSGPSLPSES
ncbi:MAG: hypothetical protein LJF06_01255 [Gemmatimonadetes bacterium]|nr:hypothetical protein [Gemmatimonadota bacterium]